MSRFTRRSLMASVGLLAALVFVTATVAGAASKKGKADSGTVYIGESHHIGKTLYQAGSLTSKVLGKGAALYTITAQTLTPGTVKATAKSVTFYTNTGSLSGTGSATLHVTSLTAATVTDGKFNLTKGTGTLKGHTLKGTFTGTGNPTSTEYVFNYKGTYK